MATMIIGLFGAITGDTQDAVASIDVPSDGFITGLDWDMNLNLDADGEAMNAELSFIATNQVGVNDVRGRISSISVMTSAITAAGTAFPVIQKWIGPMDLAVSGGERIHLHTVGGTGVTGNVRCNIHFDLRSVSARRSARR